MSSVLMDRWSLDCAIDYLQHGNNVDYARSEIYYHHINPHYIMNWNKEMENLMQQCWDNFLTAIVLWDEIWSSGFPYNWEDILSDTTMPVNDLTNIIHVVDSSMLTPTLQPLYDDLKALSTGSRLLINYLSNSRALPLSKRTEYYQILSLSLGIPYLAHPYRINLGFEDKSIYNRNDVNGLINKRLNKYYKKLNKKHGRKVCSFKYPVLIDYIIQNATSPKEELLEAISLRNDPDIVDFREAMFEIEQSVLRGDKELIAQEEQLVSDLAKEITTKHKRKGKLGEFAITTNGPIITVPISIAARRRNDLQITFIRKLLDYGVHGRQRKF